MNCSLNIMSCTLSIIVTFIEPCFWSGSAEAQAACTNIKFVCGCWFSGASNNAKGISLLFTIPSNYVFSLDTKGNLGGRGPDHLCEIIYSRFLSSSDSSLWCILCLVVMWLTSLIPSISSFVVSFQVFDSLHVTGFSVHIH